MPWTTEIHPLQEVISETHCLHLSVADVFPPSKKLVLNHPARILGIGKPIFF